MNCPKCSTKNNSKVINVVHPEDVLPKDGTTRRRRKCLTCNHRYYSIEITEKFYLKLMEKYYA